MYCRFENGQIGSSARARSIETAWPADRCTGELDESTRPSPAARVSLDRGAVLSVACGVLAEFSGGLAVLILVFGGVDTEFAHILLGGHDEHRAVIAAYLVPLLTMLLLAAASIVLGLRSLMRIRGSRDSLHGMSLAWLGVGLGVLLICVFAALVYTTITATQDTYAYEAKCVLYRACVP